MKRLVGVFREPIFSHNAIEADRQILSDALELIQSNDSSLQVEGVEAEELSTLTCQLVLSMAQGSNPLEKLARLEGQGVVVWNSTDSVRACFREEMSRLLSGAGVGYPNFSVLSHGDKPPRNFKSPVWLKRGDVHAIVDGDVFRVDIVETVGSALAAFYDRGIKRVVVQEHCEGQVFKFYGVRNGFFHCHLFNPKEEERTKLDVKKMHAFAQKAARAIGLEIYGGDCVVSSSGQMHIIDMNDWPSFRRCRKEAANAIALHAVSFFHQEKKLKRISYSFDQVGTNAYQTLVY